MIKPDEGSSAFINMRRRVSERAGAGADQAFLQRQRLDGGRHIGKNWSANLARRNSPGGHSCLHRQLLKFSGRVGGVAWFTFPYDDGDRQLRSGNA